MPGHGEQVSQERLNQLLDQGEGVDLDFKAECDLNDRAGLVAITKDIAAFSGTGGHLIIGVCEDGTPSGRFTAAAAALFDEATLRSKVAPRYLPETISITTAVHESVGAPVAIVYVGAHHNGFVVMQSDGDYTDRSGRPRQEFRRGEVYIRRGSSSRVWNNDEVDGALDRAVAMRRERWRAELRDDLIGLGVGQQARQIAEGPAASFTWQLDNDAFTATLIELLRRQDDIALTIGIDAMLRDAAEAYIGADLPTVQTILDRLCSTAAVAVHVSRRELLERAVGGLVRVYNLAYDSRGFPRSIINSISPPALWLEVVTRVYAVGALAVRGRDWATVKALTLQRGSGRDFDYYTNWLRHALTQASRAGLLQAHQDDRQIELSLLTLAAEHIARLAPLRPDIPAGDDSIVSSLTQFDLLAIFTAIADAGSLDTRSWYTNFARYDWSRSEPALITLISDEDTRKTLFPRSEHDLAEAIREVSRLASNEGFRFSVWSGWESDRVSAFLDAHPSAP
jgi:hypothetical protein